MFLRDKRIKIAAVLLLMALFIGGANYLLPRFSADGIDNALLNEFNDFPNPIDPTTINLPAQYSTELIGAAITKSKSSSKIAMTPEEKAISDYIEVQIKEKMISIPLQKGRDGSSAMNDLIFYITDSKGNLVAPADSKSKAIATVADNFNFDPSVDPADQKTMIDAYPVIESLYGPRSNTDVITVVHLPDTNRGMFSVGANKIYLDDDNDYDTAIHELIHAFHNRYCADSLWEEGFTTKMTSLVETKMNLVDMSSIYVKWGYQDDVESLPSVFDADIHNAWAPWHSALPYEYGSAIADRLYLEDNNFFKNFNTQLYKLNSNSFISRSQLLRTAILALPTIENEPSWQWFAHQYPYIDFDWADYNNPKHFFAVFYAPGSWSLSSLWLQSAEPYYQNMLSTIRIRSNENIESGDFDIRLLNAKGQVLADKDIFATTSKSQNDVFKILKSMPDALKKYQGVIKMEITPTKHPEDKRIQEIVKAGNYGAANVYARSSQGVKARLTDIVSGKTETVNAKSGYYAFTNVWSESAGRYLIEIFDANNNRINMKNFNKTKMVDFLVRVGEANNCKSRISDLLPLNRSFSLLSQTSVECAQVFSVNRVPISRTWGTESTQVAGNLTRNRSYRYSLSTATDISKPAYRMGSATTSSYPDFKLLTSEVRGNIADNTAFWRLVFNAAYDPATVHITVYDTKTTIRHVDEKTLEIVPEHLYNNAGYSLEGINDIRDMHGNPLYRMNWELASFQTPVNPPDAALPAYALSSASYKPTDTIIVRTNFQSTDLLEKINDFRIYRETDKDECGSGDDPNCGFVDFSASLNNRDIIITPKTPMISGKRYWAYPPNPVIDNNNNLVSYGLDAVLSFIVE